MNYNFDEIIDRKGTDCVKHDALETFFGRDDLLPMWVADMDFKAPQPVIEALRKRLDHEVLGYATAPQRYWDTMRQWLKSHYQIDAAQESLHFIPGIVAGISFALQAITNPSDSILVTTPVYPPFLNLPKAGGRQLRCSALKVVNGRFEIDFDEFEWMAQQSRLLILSNPHNPGGTVWGREVLARIAEVCYRYNVLVISDEIHADLTLPGHKHVSFSTVSEQARDISITFVAPSKTFNIAGLGSSICYVPNEKLRKRYFDYLDGYELANGNIFAFAGAEAAFTHGKEWLDQLLPYLSDNATFVGDYLKVHLPQAKAVIPEASYLAWIDLSALNFSHDELKRRLLNQARVALNDGTTFGGQAYQCCFRLNFGCPRATLQEALERICKALQ